MLVLGVDPGSRVTGYGLVAADDNQLRCLQAGTVIPPARRPFPERVHYIFQALREIIRSFEPAEMAVENLFFAQNVQTALRLGHARGAILAAAGECRVPVAEYSPLEIKQAVVGYGRASKEQVRSMVGLLLTLKELPDLDASDALAAAVCHIHHARFARQCAGLSKGT